ncbi:MAG: 3-hydroxyacyl-CoA dehydrogenase NAD-binding domain-containing protein, partial [Alphaproteobacteria bacterium]
MSIQTIGIVGAGAMGAGIAQIALTAGFEVILYDANERALGKAAEDVALRIARLVEKGQPQPEMIAQAAAKLVLANGLEAFATADVVIEAIVEQLEPKQGLFQALEMVVRDDAILASNTSSLSIAAIARACKHPGRVCGLHFFNPVPLMKLVEVIFGPATDAAVIEAMLDLSKRLGKTAVRVKDGPGFLVNLGGRAYVTEALHVQQEGVADVETIDRIMRDSAGFRMGPFELMDLTGIDVNFTASKVIWGGYMNDPRIKTAPLHENLFNAGRLGRKTGQGFHAYPENAPARPAYVPPEDGGKATLKAFLPEDDSRFAALVKASGLA